MMIRMIITTFSITHEPGNKQERSKKKLSGFYEKIVNFSKSRDSVKSTSIVKINL